MRRRRSTLAAMACVALWSAACGPQPTMQRGQQLYAENGCIRCHGAHGYGDGPQGAVLDPRPRDFRDASAFKNGVDQDSIARTIAEGVLRGGKMPAFAHLTDVERRSLALFVISLRDHKEGSS